MAMGRPIPMLTLTDEERDMLERWARRPTTAQALAQRARVVLACARGQTNTRVAHELRLTKQTVGKWRSRFLAARLDGLLDEPRPGAPRHISDGQVEQMVTLTLDAKPRDATHWSTRAMAARCGLSQSTVSRIWRAFGSAATSDGDLQAFPKSALHRQGVRHRRPLSESAGARPVLCVDENPKFRRSIARSRCCQCARAKS